ncbi:hypothetical protein Glove_341g10 [Diversispora epigaea]|uniref:Uncharacterized protein n=1 Tax=Diversispora epigaea TaxID=1348612 RepID=A0A397HH39_9GLOM|nr:hypothetical protein Glove_341g10 [Diversispora epigaea]
MYTNYFDNISETDKSFTHVPIPDQLATSLEDDNSSNEEDSKNNNNLKSCAVIDYIDEQAEGQLENLDALETFGVKFIKENMTGNIINNVTSKMDRAVKNHHEVLWNLIDKLVEAFQVNNHELFQNCLECTLLGFQQLYKCYETGKQCLTKIFCQEILKLETIDTTGKRSKDIVVKASKKKTKANGKKNRKKTLWQPLAHEPQPKHTNIDRYQAAQEELAKQISLALQALINVLEH